MKGQNEKSDIGKCHLFLAKITNLRAKLKNKILIQNNCFSPTTGKEITVHNKKSIKLNQNLTARLFTKQTKH